VKLYILHENSTELNIGFTAEPSPDAYLEITLSDDTKVGGSKSDTLRVVWPF